MDENDNHDGWRSYRHTVDVVSRGPQTKQSCLNVSETALNAIAFTLTAFASTAIAASMMPMMSD
jgi:hypothetical protein